MGKSKFGPLPNLALVGRDYERHAVRLPTLRDQAYSNHSPSQNF